MSGSPADEPRTDCPFRCLDCKAPLYAHEIAASVYGGDLCRPCTDAILHHRNRRCRRAEAAAHPVTFEPRTLWHWRDHARRARMFTCLSGRILYGPPCDVERGIADVACIDGRCPYCGGVPDPDPCPHPSRAQIDRGIDPRETARKRRAADDRRLAKKLAAREATPGLPRVDDVPRHERAACDLFTGPEAPPPSAPNLDLFRGTQETLDFQPEG